jgi:DNA-binding cell septation regulator SpoVG
VFAVTGILSLDEGRAAYAPITFDDCFVIHGLRLKISKKGDYFLSMPRRKQADGAYTHIVFPVDNGTANDRGEGVRGISNNS